MEEPKDWKAVTLFRFDSHFAAFRCTDLVIRAVDVLVTKPSELAFFPVASLQGLKELILPHGTACIPLVATISTVLYIEHII